MIHGVQLRQELLKAFFMLDLAENLGARLELEKSAIDRIKFF